MKGVQRWKIAFCVRMTTERTEIVEAIIFFIIHMCNKHWFSPGVLLSLSRTIWFECKVISIVCVLAPQQWVLFFTKISVPVNVFIPRCYLTSIYYICNSLKYTVTPIHETKTPCILTNIWEIDFQHKVCKSGMTILFPSPYEINIQITQ